MSRSHHRRPTGLPLKAMECETMKPFIERTEDRLDTTWADINWHAVEEHVRRLQERIYRATTNNAWRTVKNLQKLLVRATSTKLLGIRRITQEN
jgi:RNA-directed DNA polymerase